MTRLMMFHNEPNPANPFIYTSDETNCI